MEDTKPSAGRRMATGFWWLLVVGAGIMCAGYYLTDDLLRALFWLIVTVVLWQHAGRVTANVLQAAAWGQLEQAILALAELIPAPPVPPITPWPCEYCGKLTTMPHQRCQVLQAPRPPL